MPKNLGDLIYSFRYRTALPSSILETAPDGEMWIIRAAGRGRYRFVLVSDIPLTPNPNLSVTKVPDSTPGIIAKYAFSDEQALLARVRYNRLIDIFLGIACYSLQNHLRTSVPGMGQIEQDIALCADKLPDLICRPIGAQFMQENVIALFEFEEDGGDIRIVAEKQYQLVPPDAVTREDLKRYRQRLSDGAGG